jgi:hypothetical protein
MPLDLRSGTADLPVCRFHGVHCRMGGNWPLERPPEPFDAVLDLVIEAKQRLGKPFDPHPRDVWQTDRHEKVPKSELRQQEREAVALVVGLRAHNDQIEARLRDERDRNSEGN